MQDSLRTRSNFGRSENLMVVAVVGIEIGRCGNRPPVFFYRHRLELGPSPTLFLAHFFWQIMHTTAATAFVIVQRGEMSRRFGESPPL